MNYTLFSFLLFPKALERGFFNTGGLPKNSYLKIVLRFTCSMCSFSSKWNTLQ